MKMRWQPSIKIHYESNPLYIEALVNSINKNTKINWKPDLILASYHEIIQKYFDKGIHIIIAKTSRLISENLIQ